MKKHVKLIHYLIDLSHRCKSTLTEHERIHTGEKPFICPHCETSFRLSGHLRYHLKALHQVEHVGRLKKTKSAMKQLLKGVDIVGSCQQVLAEDGGIPLAGQFGNINIHDFNNSGVNSDNATREELTTESGITSDDQSKPFQTSVSSSEDGDVSYGGFDISDVGRDKVTREVQTGINNEALKSDNISLPFEINQPCSNSLYPTSDLNKDKTNGKEMTLESNTGINQSNCVLATASSKVSESHSACPPSYVNQTAEDGHVEQTCVNLGDSGRVQDESTGINLGDDSGRTEDLLNLLMMQGSSWLPEQDHHQQQHQNDNERMPDGNRQYSQDHLGRTETASLEIGNVIINEKSFMDQLVEKPYLFASLQCQAFGDSDQSMQKMVYDPQHVKVNPCDYGTNQKTDSSEMVPPTSTTTQHDLMFDFANDRAQEVVHPSGIPAETSQGLLISKDNNNHIDQLVEVPDAAAEPVLKALDNVSCETLAAINEVIQKDSTLRKSASEANSDCNEIIISSSSSNDSCQVNLIGKANACEFSLEVPLNGLEVPPKVLEVPPNGLEVPLNGLEVPPNGLEVPLNGLEVPLNGLEVPPNGCEVTVHNDEPEKNLDLDQGSSIKQTATAATCTDMEIRITCKPREEATQAVSIDCNDNHNKHGQNLDEKTRRVKRSNDNGFYCGKCSLTFRCKEDLDLHDLSHAVSRPIHRKQDMDDCRKMTEDITTDGKSIVKHLCEICGKSYRTKSSLFHHKKSHSSKVYNCVKCQQTFNSLNVMRLHNVNCHDGMPPHKCGSCGKGFLHVARMEEHVRIQHTGEMPFSCPRCDKSFTCRRNLRRHVNEPTCTPPKERFPCDQCAKTCKTRYSLSYHKAIHHAQRPYHCELCGKGYATKENCTRHENNHGRLLLQRSLVKTPKPTIKDHVCTICHKAYSNKHFLARHSKTHTGVKPFRCGVCQKEFLYKSALKEHSRTHTNERPYVCQHCGVAFRLGGHLRYHIKAVHDGDRPHSCAVCGKGFVFRSTMLLHVKTHVGDAGGRKQADDLYIKNYQA